LKVDEWDVMPDLFFFREIEKKIDVGDDEDDEEDDEDDEKEEEAWDK